MKEASGNITQMCEICRAVPPDFIVLSGDDALTLPVMAVGGRGIISVASNEIPAEMAQMVEAAERGDFAAARAIHSADAAADAGQLRRVEPDSGEGGDGGDGTARGDLPAADGAAARRVARADPRACLTDLRLANTACLRMSLQTLIESLVGRGRRGGPRSRARRVRALREALSSGAVRAAEPDASAPPAGA